VCEFKALSCRGKVGLVGAVAWGEQTGQQHVSSSSSLASSGSSNASAKLLHPQREAGGSRDAAAALAVSSVCMLCADNQVEGTPGCVGGCVPRCECDQYALQCPSCLAARLRHRVRGCLQERERPVIGWM